jgi:hypothetical protein
MAIASLAAENFQQLSNTRFNIADRKSNKYTAAEEYLNIQGEKNISTPPQVKVQNPG